MDMPTLIMAKQVSKLSRQVAVLRSCLLVTWMAQEESGFIQNIKGETLKNYGYNAQKYEDAASREQKLGPLHLRVWDNILLFMMGELQEQAKHNYNYF